MWNRWKNSTAGCKWCATQKGTMKMRRTLSSKLTSKIWNVDQWLRVRKPMCTVSSGTLAGKDANYFSRSKTNLSTTRTLLIWKVCCVHWKNAWIVSLISHYLIWMRCERRKYIWQLVQFQNEKVRMRIRYHFRWTSHGMMGLSRHLIKPKIFYRRRALQMMGWEKVYAFRMHQIFIRKWNYVTQSIRSIDRCGDRLPFWVIFSQQSALNHSARTPNIIKRQNCHREIVCRLMKSEYRIRNVWKRKSLFGVW